MLRLITREGFSSDLMIGLMVEMEVVLEWSLGEDEKEVSLRRREWEESVGLRGLRPWKEGGERVGMEKRVEAIDGEVWRW